MNNESNGKNNRQSSKPMTGNPLRTKDVAHVLDCSPDNVIEMCRKGTVVPCGLVPEVSLWHSTAIHAMERSGATHDAWPAGHDRCHRRYRGEALPWSFRECRSTGIPGIGPALRVPHRPDPLCRMPEMLLPETVTHSESNLQRIIDRNVNIRLVECVFR
jgi:hypothetical protein